MGHSKLTSKYQATIPKEVRKQLQLKPGDAISFHVGQNGSIIIKKAMPFDKAYAQSLSNVLSEWESEEDEQAYADLQNV